MMTTSITVGAMLYIAAYILPCIILRCAWWPVREAGLHYRQSLRNIALALRKNRLDQTAANIPLMFRNSDYACPHVRTFRLCPPSCSDIPTMPALMSGYSDYVCPLTRSGKRSPAVKARPAPYRPGFSRKVREKHTGFQAG